MCLQPDDTQWSCLLCIVAFQQPRRHAHGPAAAGVDVLLCAEAPHPFEQAGETCVMALQVREMLHTKEMASKLAGLDMKPDDLLKSLLGPWGPSNPQTDLERHKMEKSLTGAGPLHPQQEFYDQYMFVENSCQNEC